MQQKPALYGLINSNRDFSSPYSWGKNQFNSSFPAALACYMRDQNIAPVFIKHGQESNTVISDISFDDFWHTTLPNKKLFFSFESRFTPYAKMTLDDIQPIDLVVSENESKRILAPVEVKLTTIPDNTTVNDTEANYGSELVVRSPTMRYAAMGMGQSCSSFMTEVKDLFSPACAKIRDWDNVVEVSKHRDNIIKTLDIFLNTYSRYEQPLLMQPVWKTIGKTPVLADNCLDIFVWSDFALCRLLLGSGNGDDEKISRPQRASLRLARFLYELSTKGKVYQKPIYDGMTFDNLNDKEFAISGKKTNLHMRCDRLTRPIIEKGEIKEIILGDGQKFLSPERRFDAIIYYSNELFNEL
ncbi:MAG: HindVP family restriction endonuclease [Chlorobium sp.]